MNSATQDQAASTTVLLNPIIGSVNRTFESMLGTTPRRVGLEVKNPNTPKYPLSAIIALTGKMSGTIIFSVSKEAALGILSRLLFDEAEEITPDVCDAVGEIANMIAGSAKADLENLNLTLSIPNMVLGEDYEVHYPPEVTLPMCITFESDIGPFSIEFGFRG